MKGNPHVVSPGKKSENIFPYRRFLLDTLINPTRVGSIEFTSLHARSPKDAIADK